jgi:hypothetical protein
MLDEEVLARKFAPNPDGKYRQYLPADRARSAKSAGLLQSPRLRNAAARRSFLGIIKQSF